MYMKEQEDQRIKVEKFIADNAEEWDIKNGASHDQHYSDIQPRMHLLHKAMYEESKKMVKDASDRLGKAVIELRDLVVSIIEGCCVAGVYLSQVSSKPDSGIENDDEALVKAEEMLESASV